MRKWERLIGILLAVFLVSAALWFFDYEPEITAGSITTREGVVIDRAMSDGLPYISVAFADGTSVCCWEIHRDAEIPDDISCGDSVYITYGVEEDHGRCAVLAIKLEGEP